MFSKSTKKYFNFYNIDLFVAHIQAYKYDCYQTHYIACIIFIYALLRIYYIYVSRMSDNMLNTHPNLI